MLSPKNDPTLPLLLAMRNTVVMFDSFCRMCFPMYGLFMVRK